MIDIFDFSIVRIAARSLNELFTIEQKSLSNLCADINLLKKNKIAQIEQVCEQLYLEIKQSNNTDNQKKLLNLKRDIYNERYKIENLQKKNPSAFNKYCRLYYRFNGFRRYFEYKIL